MDILTDDMKKDLKEKFNGLDTKDEKFQEQVQTIVEELIEVNKKKIGDFVAQKTVDEALEEEKEGFKELQQLKGEGVLEEIQDNVLKNDLKQQAKDGIADEILEKVSLEKAGFLKEPQKSISVDDIIEEVLNQLEEIIEEKKKKIDDEIAKKEEVIKKVEKREKLRVAKNKMSNLHQKTKTYKGTEGKRLNENVEKAVIDLDKQINALVAETTVDNKELQSEELKREKEELIEQKNKLSDMLKSIKEKYMKDKVKDNTNSKGKDNFQEGNKEEKEDKPKDDKSKKEDKEKDSKKEDENKKNETNNEQSLENKDDKKSKETKTSDSEAKKEEQEDDDRRTKAIENRISMIVNKIRPDIEPEELVEKSEKIREYYKSCIEKGYTKEEMDKALKYVPLKIQVLDDKENLYEEKSFTAADLVEIGKINQIRRKYLEITDKPTITQEDEKIIKECQKKFDDLSDKVYTICDGGEVSPLLTSEEYIEELRVLKIDAKKKTRWIERKIRKLFGKPSKSQMAVYETQELRRLLEKIVSGEKAKTIYAKYNEVIESLENNKTIESDTIPQRLEIEKENEESKKSTNAKKDNVVEKCKINPPKELMNRSDSSKEQKVVQDDKEEEEELE